MLEMTTSRRTLLVAALATPLLGLLAACGDDTKSTDSTTGATTGTTGSTGTPATTDPSLPPQAEIAHPGGADDVILRLGYVGGFVPVGYAFTNVPTLLVSGDGRLITQAPVAAIYPGPLLPALNVRTISEAGIQKLLQLADTAGLLKTPPDYSGEILVADAPDTQVVISADGATYIHQAPALGFEERNESDARRALAKFAELLGDIGVVVGNENLGEDAPLVAGSYRIQARPQTVEDLAAYDPAPTEMPWPAEIGVVLADAAECALIPAEAVSVADALFAEATQITFFKEADVVYQVAAVALLPGDVC